MILKSILKSTNQLKFQGFTINLGVIGLSFLCGSL